VSRYRKVDPRIWNDEKFRALSNKGKLVFFMLLTHPSMTALGAMRGTTSGLAEELGWPVEAFRDAFNDVLAQDMVEQDSKACLIALPNFIRYNRPESPNVVKAWVGALDLLPECDLKQAVVQRAKGFVGEMPKGFRDAFRESFDKGMPYQEQEQEPEQEESPLTPVKPGGVVLPGFDRFWTTWPTHGRKVAKAQCLRKWVSKGCELIAEAVVAAVEAAKASDAWTKEKGDFIPAPLVWLNQNRWEAPTEAQAAAERPEPNVPRSSGASVETAEETRARLDADEARFRAQDPAVMAANAAAAREAAQRMREARLATARGLAEGIAMPATEGEAA
jgi:hypothetical protein